MFQFQQKLNIKLAMRRFCSLVIHSNMPIFINLFIFPVIWVQRRRIPELPPSSGLSVSFPEPELDVGCLLLGVCPQLTGVIMVGITYRSASARPSISSTNKSVIPHTQEGQQIPARGPAPSFKDKETYQELFKPLPKPEPIPVFTQFKVGNSMPS